MSNQNEPQTIRRNVNLWILFGDTDERGVFQPIVWNLAFADGRVYVKPSDIEVRALWMPGDVMAYYPLTA